MKGQIVKISSDLHFISCDDEVYPCKCRGIFRKEHITPLVGDYVLFSKEKNLIESIVPRKNEFQRPKVSNIDQAFLITSLVHPDFSLNLLDKLIVLMEINNVEPIICITKEDITDEENLKEVGFAVSDYDLGTGIFNDEYLHNYSFYQDATISLVPTYSIYVDMEIEIVPLYNQNITCCYYSTLEISNNYNCNHVITYEDGGGNVHIVSCDLCGYYYYEDHDSYCINQGEVGHNLCCAYCDNYLLEPHSLRISNGGNQCINCSYFEQTTISYISNNDGVTHRIQSGTITETDFCFGLVASDGNVYCVMCGQNMSDFVLNSVMHPYDDLLIE